MINKRSPLPIYYQLETYIKNLIESGQLNPGDSLPSEREYAERFEISRMTVRQAINSLVQSGLLYRKKGSGTYVAEKKLEQKLQGLTSFSEDMKNRGMKASSTIIKFEEIEATPLIANELRLKESSKIYEIMRVRHADDEPMAIEINYMLPTIVSGLTEDVLTKSTYAFFEASGLYIEHATQIIETAKATNYQAQLLNINENDSLLLIQRKTYLQDGTPLEFVKSYYRGDRYKFVVTIDRHGKT
ncbi:GntR family transcriptional regulator [Sutcliffiella cohnii]